MRVLMYGWEFPPHISGGLGVACYNIVKALAKQGIEVALILPIAQDCEPYNEHVSILGADQSFKLSKAELESTILNPYLTNENLFWEQQHSARKNVAGVLYRRNLLEEVHRYAAIAGNLAKKIPHDVIHAHDWLTVLAGIEAKKYSGKPLLYHVHALEPDRSGDSMNQEVYRIEKQGMEQADKVIAVSQHTKDTIIKYYGIDPKKIFVVYNGIDCLDEKELKLPEEKHLKTVLFAGRITHQKGPYFFIEIAKKILSKRQDIRFVVAGQGDLLKEMIDHAANLKIGKYIHFMGFADTLTMKKLFQMSDVYVMTSISEPFGLTCLEAAANKVPVIISKQSGVTEVMPHVLKADFWDTQEMAAKILTLLDKPALQKMLKENAHEALQNITWDKAVNQLIQIYRNL